MTDYRERLLNIFDTVTYKVCSMNEIAEELKLRSINHANLGKDLKLLIRLGAIKQINFHSGSNCKYEAVHDRDSFFKLKKIKEIIEER